MKEKFDLTTKEGRREYIIKRINAFPYDNLIFVLEYNNYIVGMSDSFGVFIKPKKHWWQYKRLFDKKLFEKYDLKKEYDEIIEEIFNERVSKITKEEVKSFINFLNDKQIRLVRVQIETLPQDLKDKYSNLIQLTNEVLEELKR